MNKNFDYHIPSFENVKTCLEGYRDFGFDRAILDNTLKNSIDNLPKIKRINKSQG